MTVKRAFRDHDLRSAFKATFQKFVDKARPAGARFNQVIRFPGRHSGRAVVPREEAAPVMVIQPIALPETPLPVVIPTMLSRAQVDGELAEIVALAIDRLAPASMRASATGTEVEVSVADQGTAAAFRAALALTSQHRATDRLVRIVVAGRR